MSSQFPTALVTGASRGIGRAIALGFANRGYLVWALARVAELCIFLASPQAAAITGVAYPIDAGETV